MKILEPLKWRAAVRKFDTSKDVSDVELEALLDAGNLTATSMGLQPFKIVVVKNKTLQQELVPLSYNQQHVAEASHILVFAIETDINQDNVDRYIERAMELRNLPSSALEGYKNSISQYMSSMSSDQKQVWATKQTYIALGTVMTIAAELKIDSCAMEGFDPVGYQKMLNLESENLMPVVILPIGFRSNEEVMASLPKVRKTRDEFVLEVD